MNSIKMSYTFGKYRGEADATFDYSGYSLLEQQLRDIPYSKQIRILYNSGFSPKNLTGEQDVIILTHKDTKKSIVLYKGIGIFTFGGNIISEEVKFIYFGNSVYGFQVRIGEKWFLYFRNNTSLESRESKNPCYTHQVKNGFSQDGSFQSFGDIDKATSLYFTYPISNDIVDILEMPSRY